MRNGEYEMVRAPSHFPGKLYRGKYCYEHVLVWWIFNKTVPNDNEIIHHLDRNKLNNTIKNLSLQSRSEHAKHHGSEQQCTKFIVVCEKCRKLFIRRKNQIKARLQFCSRDCFDKFDFKARRKHVTSKTLMIEMSKEVITEVKQVHKLDPSTTKLYAKWFPQAAVKRCSCGKVILSRLTYCSPECYRKSTCKYSEKDLLSSASNSNLAFKYGVSGTAIRKARLKLTASRR